MKPVASRGVGGLQLPNNLLKLVNSVSEKGCERQGRGVEDWNSYMLEEGTRIYQNGISFKVIQLKNFKISWKDLHQPQSFASFNGRFSKMGPFPMT